MSSYRVTADVGGTFTDVAVAEERGVLAIGKAPTRANPVEGVLEALANAASAFGCSSDTILEETSVFIYSTTKATNAIVEAKVAKTALLVTKGFPDTLVLREGGRADAFDRRSPYPEPYIPRALTYEISERIDSEGTVVVPLDEQAARATLGGLQRVGVEAVAVCLLWATANSDHEVRMGELIEEVLPGIPYTLSHRLNPIVREFRRASATAIDASLKPLMGSHFSDLAKGLRRRGLTADLMVATSQGGVIHVEDITKRPIDSVKSGPSMAPVAGISYARAAKITRDLIVCDAGGTSFDVSLVRDGRVSYSRDTWLGHPFTGHLTGVSSVDVRSIGSGGGSIAWLDAGGLLRVGPRSAGAEPGPACYGRGGTEPTVTDAAAVLGLIDPETFLGGRMRLDISAARRAVTELAAGLNMRPEEAAAAVLAVIDEHMVRAIHELTVKEGFDPREAMVVAGGGAGGLSVVSLVRELGARHALVPRTASALSACGAMFSDLVSEFSLSAYADTAAFDFESVNAALDRLDARVDQHAERLRRRGITEFDVERFVDARYMHQVWELEVELPFARFAGTEDLSILSHVFDKAHLRVFSVAEPGARLECITWRARLRATVAATSAETLHLASAEGHTGRPRFRHVCIDGEWRETRVYLGEQIEAGDIIAGPAIIEEPTTTLVIPSGASARLTDANAYYVEV